MKELKKQFQTKDVTLVAYYTCMCNYPPCTCDGYRDAGSTQSLLDGEHNDLRRIEDASWNN